MDTLNQLLKILGTLIQKLLAHSFKSATGHSNLTEAERREKLQWDGAVACMGEDDDMRTTAPLQIRRSATLAPHRCSSTAPHPAPLHRPDPASAHAELALAHADPAPPPPRSSSPAHKNHSFDFGVVDFWRTRWERKERKHAVGTWWPATTGRKGGEAGNGLLSEAATGEGNESEGSE